VFITPQLSSGLFLISFCSAHHNLSSYGLTKLRPCLRPKEADAWRIVDINLLFKQTFSVTNSSSSHILSDLNMRAVSWNLSSILSIFNDFFFLSNGDFWFCFNCTFFGKYCSCIPGCLRALTVPINVVEKLLLLKNNALRHREEGLCSLPCNPLLVFCLMHLLCSFPSKH